MKQRCAKTLDIGLIEARLNKLSEAYRQVLRAAEFLPTCGSVPVEEFHSEVGQPITKKRNPFKHKTMFKIEGKKSPGDWARSRFAFRPMARMLLRSHIRSKLRAIADRLDVEQFADANRGANYSSELDEVIKKLWSFDARLGGKGPWLSKVGSGIWAVSILILPTILSHFIIPSNGITAPAIIIYFGTGLLWFAFFAWFPLFYFVALGGLRWKRLILLGQTGDVYIDIAALVRWCQAPLANTYHLENQVFEALGLPKPTEFPWDIALSPDKLLSAVLAVALLSLALALTVSMKQFDWPFIVAMILEFIAIGFLSHAVRSTFRTKRYRLENSMC